MFKIGDRVTYKRAYRSRGAGSGKGGWKWAIGMGTVTYYTKTKVWVQPDTQSWEDSIRLPIDIVQLIPPPDNAG
jgi:hypothetical protein